MYKIKSKNLILVILTITMAFLINGCAKKAPEGVVAVVNEEEITIEEFEKEYNIQASTMESRLGEGVLDGLAEDGEEVKDKLKTEVLNIFVIEKLIMQDAQENGIEVSEDEINKRKEIIKENMGGEEGLKEYQELVGMDDNYLNNFIKKDLILEKHKVDYIDNLELKDKEIKKFFKENKEDLTLVNARQILVETQGEGEELLKQLKSGGDFKSLAIANSKDPDTALKGGELGYIAKGNNPKEFDEVVFGLKKGEISPLIQTELGYHIVEVQEIKDTFESLEGEITQFANENKYVEYLEKLQDDGKIEIYLDEIDKEDKEDKE